MTEEGILKEVIGDDDDDLDEEKEEDLEIVDESFLCPTESVVMSARDTLSIFQMFNDASVKVDVIALPSKIETSLTNRRKKTNIKLYFAPLSTKRNLEISYTCLLWDCFAIFVTDHRKKPWGV